jgi:hypothetical protein
MAGRRERLVAPEPIPEAAGIPFLPCERVDHGGGGAGDGRRD